MRNTGIAAVLAGLVIGAVTGVLLPAAAEEQPSPTDAEARMVALLDAPLLFTKRHSYTGIHIYDTYYKWPPGGGGIYVLENPSAPRDQWRIRAVIDPSTPETLGVGVYDEPELSWDARRVLFTFKGEPNGSTSICEIGIDGRGLRRLTDPTPACDHYHGSLSGQHDVYPAYLPDDRIVFLSTRPSGLVPCNNTGVAILHVMNADGSDIRPISVNNVNEFDPAVLPDGRILFGRWEYVDKNALTIQSLWTINPDGTQETALYANNMYFPEAILDARPVPGTHRIVGTFAKHNGTPRGSIALVDPRRGKNDPSAIENLEHPDDPTYDRGESCEPWPVAEDVFVYSGRPPGSERNALMMIDRSGRKFVLHSDPDICLHSPMLVKPRPRPPIIPDVTDRRATTGRFFVQDIYQGLDGVARGEVRQLRVLEETSRVSASTMGGSPYNQTFLASAALGWGAKNYLGVVPVEEDGSAYFEAPSGRALYLQALDAEGRLVQSMRTFVQAAPGATRSCVGCHEHKYSATAADSRFSEILDRQPEPLRPERWGSGYVDYASMVQPVLDRHCVACHGGREGFAAGIDLSGGWTEHFSISYENLVNRRETQLTAYWIAGIDCMNGTAPWSSQMFPPRSHGSGAAPLGRLLVEGHEGRLDGLSRAERDLLMAWIDSNGLYYGTWDSTAAGCAIRHWDETRQRLVAEMREAGCLRCHGDGEKATYFENDWINLREPEMSRLLRAPLAQQSDAAAEGFGLAMCRDRKVDASRQRIHLLRGGYAHAVQPPDRFPKHTPPEPDPSGEPVARFASTADPHYQAMLAIIREARDRALANPRADMPGAEVIPGECRTFIPPPLPSVVAPPVASADPDGVVHLAWERSARTIGLVAELHRSGDWGFAPGEETLVARTTLGRHVDRKADPGRQHYALVFVRGEHRGEPVYATVEVPPPAPPGAPTELLAAAASGSVRLSWRAPPGEVAGFHVYRGRAGIEPAERLTSEPVRTAFYADATVESDVPYRYVVRAVGRRGQEGSPSEAVEGKATFVREPVFTAEFDRKPGGRLLGGEALEGKLHGAAQAASGVLDLTGGGHATFPNHEHFHLGRPITVSCWVRFDEPGRMPVVASCGQWNQAGWFLQRFGNRWRWHLGGLDCDGGAAPVGRWVHVAGTFDGRTARLYENGKQVAEAAGAVRGDAWPGALHAGQYGAMPGPDYQTTGRVAGLTIHHRPLAEQEIADAAKTPPGE